MCLFTSDLPVDMCPSRKGKKSFTSLLLSSSSSYVLSTDNICTHFVSRTVIYTCMLTFRQCNNFVYNCLHVKFTKSVDTYVQ